MKILGVSLILFCACAITANAAMRVCYEDVAVVDRSELIVVGHLKDNSLQYVAHTNEPTDGDWSENRATLVVSAVIKGASTNVEIPIVIHYGLEVVIGRDRRDDEFEMYEGGVRKDYPTNLVRIFAMRGSQMIIGERPAVEDASKDNLWFLRRGGGIYGEIPGAYDLGVMDGQDMQPLNTKEYFELYLSDNREEAIRAYAANHPESAWRAQRWLDGLEYQRLLNTEDPKLRLERILPYFLNREGWGASASGLVSCGSLAGARLVSIFQDPNHKNLRLDIITTWGDMNYTPAAPLLIQLLQDADRFWGEQKLTNGWRNADNSELTQRRRQLSGEVYYAAASLRKLHDPRSKEALELTKKRWESPGFDDQRVMEECDAALKELDAILNEVLKDVPQVQ
ncbi:MAG: hypothetical protein ABSA47_18175 [Verrucomicrobiota bacterium]